MYIRRSRSVLLSHPAIGYPDVKCRRTERPPFPSDVRIPDVNIRGGKCAAAGCKMAACIRGVNGTSRVQILSERNVVRMPSDGISGRPVRVYSLYGFQRTLLNLRFALVIKKTIKTPKLNTIWLELIARVLNMLIGLKGDNYYSKVFKRVNYRLSNNTFWVVITPPNRHIASPLAMKERKIKINSTIIYNIMLNKKQFPSGMMI